MRKAMKKYIGYIALFVVVSALFAPAARADVIAVGPMEIGSWGQAWNFLTAGAPYDHVQLFLLGGGPTWTVTETDANWSVTSANATMAILDGSAGINQIFGVTTTGAGDLADALFLTQKWDTTGATPILNREYLIGRQGGTGWDPAPGGGWYIKVLDNSGPGYQATVPDGGLTVIMLGMSLIVLILGRRMVKY